MEINPDCIDRYSVRRLSPFMGCWQVLYTPVGRAISGNGLDWQIQPKVHMPKPTRGGLDQGGLDDNGETDEYYCQYSHWNATTGVRRLPLNPAVHLETASHHAETITRLLCENGNHLPFPAKDLYELWMLDEQTQDPVILVQTRTKATDLSLPERFHWRPVDYQQQDLTYLDALLKQQSITQFDSSIVERLLDIIKSRCGRIPNYQWFLRGSQGSGIGLNSRPQQDGVPDRTLPREKFPVLLHAEQWPDPDAGEFMQCYLNWLAPYLLTLFALPTDYRAKLELQACKQPLLLADRINLVPDKIHHDALNVALVEAQLRRC